MLFPYIGMGKSSILEHNPDTVCDDSYMLCF